MNLSRNPNKNFRRLNHFMKVIYKLLAQIHQYKLKFPCHDIKMPPILQINLAHLPSLESLTHCTSCSNRKA